MTQDRQLINTIKLTFAEYSSAQLHEIEQSKGTERWSVEAITAAGEILLDRIQGRAPEPVNPKEPPPLPPPGMDPDSLAGLIGLIALGAANGIVVMPRFNAGDEDSANADQPVAFGSNIAWLAVDSTDTQDVAAALGLRGAQEASWEEGIEAAYRWASVFVTPPVGDWTLAVGASLFPPDKAEAFVKPLLERLSRQFGDAQYFCSHREVDLHIWARARKGRLIRGYGWLGQKRLTLWDEGTATREERDAGIPIVDAHSTAMQQGQEGETPDSAFADESCVMHLASLWSIDPSALDEEFKEPVMGLLGSLPRRARPTEIAPKQVR